ncbi:MAG: YDG domain-containing protein, partial [Bacteroidales bacterium]
LKEFVLTITAEGIDKMYDGNTQATVNLFDNRQPGDQLTIAYTHATFDTKNVGTGKSVFVNGIMISGRDADKYGYNTTTTTTADIVPKPITVMAVADSKEYNGTIVSDEVPTISPNLVFDDTAEFIQTYDTKNVGTGKTMSPSGRVNDGNDGNNYTVTYHTVDLGIITPKPITGSITAADKVYDGTIAATILTRTLNGVILRDDVSYVGGTANFDTPTVGQGKTVTGTGFSLTGADASNYTVNDSTTTKADILVLVVGTTLAVNASTFTHYSDQVTLTATVSGGAPLANGPQAAASVIFSIEGRVIRGNSNNANIPLVVSGPNLVATITVSILETTITGSMVPGTKGATAYFNDENINYKLVPNPTKASFEFSPGFNILVYPNPSPGLVNFKISVDAGAIVILDLYASDGQLVARVFEGFIPTGESKTIPYHGYLAQGIYRYRARIGNEVKMGNVIIIGVY